MSQQKIFAVLYEVNLNARVEVFTSEEKADEFVRSMTEDEIYVSTIQGWYHP